MIQKINKEELKEARPVFELMFSLLDEVEKKEQELSSVRHIAGEVNKQLIQANENVQKLERQNHAMQLFIEENVDEEKKKEIFKSEPVH
jgi:hypothetical protein